MSEKRALRTTIGGQALIEGIIMLGPDKSAIVVRKPDGSLEIKEESAGAVNKNKFFRLPFIRGIFNLYISLKRGIGALTYSAQFYDDGSDTDPGRFEMWLEKKFGKDKVESFSMTIALVIGILFPIGLFILLPTLLVGLWPALAASSSVLRNAAEGILRILIFIGFLFFVSRMKDIRRTFMYHGAEHKSIFCYEAGKELTVENAQQFKRMHPRCGTSFLFVVMIISILLFSFVPWSNPLLRVLMRLLLLPVVVGIAYEINRFAGRHDNYLTRVLRAPGLWLQHLTTYEPDDNMVEVAIEALSRVIPEEKGADEW